VPQLCNATLGQYDDTQGIEAEERVRREELAILVAQKRKAAAELEYECTWKQSQELEAELAFLRERRQCYLAGDLTAAYHYQPEAALHPPAQTTSGRSHLPKPEPPHAYSGKNWANYNNWSRDCEFYFERSKIDFLTDKEKVEFALQYVQAEPQNM